MNQQKATLYRANEKARIQSFLQPTNQAHEVRGLFLVGEEGIGKSALVDVAVSENAAAFATIVRGSAFPITQNIPLGLISALLRSFLKIPTPSLSQHSTEGIEKRLAPLLGDQWESVRPALFYLLHSPDQKTYTHLFTLPSDQLKHQLFWALRQIVKAITQQGPLLIIVENLQWADDVSLDFLSASLSLEPLAPVRFLGTTWPEGWERLVTLAEGHHTKANIQEIVLAPFSEQEALAFIQTLVPSISPAYITALLTQSQGNPLYIQSIAEDFQLGIREIETPLPATIGEIFLHRLPHLPPSVRTLVEVASIIGSPIDIAVLEKIIERKGLAVNDLRQELETAQAWGFLQPVENTWVFRAHAIEKAIYTSLAPAIRSEWHLLIAQTIEHLWPIEHPWRLAYLATHYQQGAHAQQAVQYLLKAGTEATQQHAKREAITLLSQAHTLAQSSDIDLLTQRYLAITLGDAFFATGQYEQAASLYEEALHITEQMPEAPPRLKAEVLRLQGRIAEVRGKYSEAIEWFKQAYALLEERERDNAERLEKARICSDLGLTYHRQGLFKEAEQWLQSALALAMTAEDDLLSSEILRRLGPLVFSKGDIALAAHYLEQALQIQQHLNAKYTVARTLVNLGACYNALGNWQKALTVSEEALQILLEFGDLEGVTAVKINLGQMWYRLGEIEKAQTLLAQAIQLAQRINHQHFLAIALLNKTQLHLYCNEIPEAVEASADIPEITPTLVCRKHHVLSEIALRNGWIDEAQHLFEQAEKILQAEPSVGGSKLPRMYHHRLKGLLAAAQGKYHHALAELQMAIDLAPDDYEKALFLTEAAEIAHHMGDTKFTNLYLSQARPLAEKLDAQFLLNRLDNIQNDLSSHTIS
ncbi:hypothetical protein ARMA_1414 [Ardenticatena maritima]|uniref:Orc1-like AAA ATPase domain-containing protein n=1 Tax=Ardenticatena maritima TaxID=872965 RepID=A0A0M8K8H7_9CHLR|nr:tetratricopeptide repeat protein [Ardenticatena maritima]KPL89476.1 hypothetical protein SE16_03300 [Ardenticatena maritima]GAP62991.1 hypothetical protein ARMA_1414 [Ardenticatena maritima]